MKKLLLASAAIIISSSAHADMYTVGSVTPNIPSGNTATDHTIAPGDLLIIADGADGSWIISGHTLTFTNAALGDDGFGELTANGTTAKIVSLGTITAGISDLGQIEILGGAHFEAVDVILGVNGRGRLNIRNAGTYASVTGAITMGSVSGSRLVVDNTALADFATVNMTTPTNNTLTFDVINATANVTNLNLDAARGTVNIHSNGTLNTDNFDMKKGTLFLNTNGTLDAQTGTFNAKEGDITLSANASLKTSNATISTTTFFSQSTWQDDGHVNLMGDTTFTDSTATLDTLTFKEAGTSIAPDRLILHNST